MPVSVDAGLADSERTSDDSSCGQAAEHSGAISIAAPAITAVSTVVVVTAMSPTAAMMAKTVMAILDRLRVRSDLAQRVVRHKRRSRDRLDRDERRRAKQRCRKQGSE